MSCTEAFDPNFKMDVDGVTPFWQPFCVVLSCLGRRTSTLSNEKSHSENLTNFGNALIGFSNLQMLISKYQGKSGDKDVVASF